MCSPPASYTGVDAWTTVADTLLVSSNGLSPILVSELPRAFIESHELNPAAPTVAAATIAMISLYFIVVVWL